MSKRQTRPIRAVAVLEQLKRCAREQRTITYGDLAIAVYSHPQAMGKPLVYIRDEVCNRYVRPRLDALVVQQKSRIPSDGFFSDVNADDPIVWWLDMIQQVFSYDWSDVELGD